MTKKQNYKIDPTDEDFGTICVCAIRYALGRETYMPSIVQDFIRQYLTYLSVKTLCVIERDIVEAEFWGGYGHETIDKPGWIAFLNEVRATKNEKQFIAH